MQVPLVVSSPQQCSDSPIRPCAIFVMPMQYVRLGKSGLKVSRLILGMASYGDPRFLPWVIGEDEALKHIKLAYERGIQTFDTANVYSSGVSEKILGNAIKKLNLPRDELVIMTKIGLPMFPVDDPDALKKYKTPEKFGIINQHGLSRKHIFDAVKGSLGRLQVDYIDVLQCHRFDPNTPIEETMHALHDVVKAGWVRYVAMSSCWAYQFHAMQNYAITHNLTPFISVQNHYNLLYREEEREMLPTLKVFGVGSTPWSSLAKGLLTRPYDTQPESVRSKFDPGLQMYKNEQTPLIVGRVQEISKRRGVSMARISLAWLLSKEGVTAPIVGPSSLEKLEDLLGSLDVELTPDEIKYLEEPYAPMRVCGHS
ncbi:Aldo/keto reductase [Trametes punicea]|nr:Aldo/keto reductase [Trametes punicea]